MSTYPVLDNKPIDQWRVTELKEELKRRRLPVRGLKDDLIRRLDEALRAESETANDEIPAIDETESAKATDDVDETGKKNQETEKMSETVNESDNKNEETGDVRVESGNSKIELGDSDKIQADKDDDLVSHGKENVLEDSTVMEEESKMSVETTTVETAVTVSEGMVNEPGLISESVVNESGLIGESAVNETGLISESVVNETGLITESVVNETGLISESMVNETGLIGEDLKNETENKKEESELELELKIEDPESSDVKNQVFEVSEVKSESIYNNTTTVTTTTSTNTIVSVDERNEQLKENIIADDVKLEFDVKPLSSENIIVDDGKLLVPMDSDDLQEEEKKKNEVDCGEGTGGDVGLAEKLNLERSSGEDSMEEDGLESKENNDSKLNSDERVKTGDGVNVDNLSAEPEKKIVDFESKNESAVPDVKRKFNGGGQESGMNNDNNNIEITKRQRRWNSEGQNLNISTNSTNSAAMPKRNFSRSDSMASKEPHKERVVPPSSKPSTTSLRIDRFLRPFTLKAVQELLGKTGSVTSFWMDNIKTHCYVTYSSVEEAEETRNAVYNLQWPPNGGRLLVAEFVDPQEVKTRVEAPPPSPATPSTAAPPLRPPPPPPAASVPSPRLPMQRQQLPPPPSLPPPPPPPQLTLPPPPPLPERVLPPIVTLDDLFRKTKATPRIYYLPLTDEQVEHKAKMAQGKIATAN